MKYPICLIACGSNNTGQLGSQDTEDHHTFTDTTFLGYEVGLTPTGTTQIVDMACGAGHTLVLIERQEIPSGSLTKELWGCGDGRKGQLGLAEFERQTSANFQSNDSSTFRKVDFSADDTIRDRVCRNGMNPKLISATWETSFVVFEAHGCNDLVVSMGANDWGCLGVGSEKIHGISNSRTGHIVDLSPWDLGINSFRITNIKAGQSHVILQYCLPDRDDHREVFLGWGKSRHGQLGGGAQSEERKPPKHKVKVKEMNYADHPCVVHISKTPSTRYALGAQHSVFLHSDGGIVGYGSNKKTQQAVVQGVKEMPQTFLRDVDCTWNGTYLCGKQEDRMVILASGGWEKGQLGYPRVTTSNITQVEFPRDIWPQRVACGTEHVLACCEKRTDSTNATQVWGWGWNEHGNLGTGDTLDIWTPRRIWPPLGEEHGRKVCGVWAGAATSWIEFKRLH